MTMPLSVAEILGPRRMPKATFGTLPTCTGVLNVRPPSQRSSAINCSALAKGDVNLTAGRDCHLGLRSAPQFGRNDFNRPLADL